MITKCRFCDYQKETPLPEAILTILASDDLASEDYVLWFQRLIAVHSTHDWNGVKVHMGRMHKGLTYYGIWPDMDYSDIERPLVTKFANHFDEIGGSFAELVAAGPLTRPQVPERFRWL